MKSKYQLATLYEIAKCYCEKSEDYLLESIEKQKNDVMQDLELLDDIKRLYGKRLYDTLKNDLKNYPKDKVFEKIRRWLENDI